MEIQKTIRAGLILIIFLAFYGCGTGGGGSSDSLAVNRPAGSEAAVAASLAAAESGMNKNFNTIAGLISSFQTPLAESANSVQGAGRLESDLAFFDSLISASTAFASDYANWLKYSRELAGLIPKSALAMKTDDLFLAAASGSGSPNVNTESESFLFGKLKSFLSSLLDTKTSIDINNVNDFTNSAIKEKNGFENRWRSKMDANGNGRISPEEYVNFQKNHGTQYNRDKLDTTGRIAGDGAYTVIKTAATAVIGIAAGATATLAALPAAGVVVIGATAAVAAETAFDYFLKPTPDTAGKGTLQAFPVTSSDIYFIQGQGRIGAKMSIPAGRYDGMFFVPGKGPIYIHDIPVSAGQIFTVTDLSFVDESAFRIRDIFGRSFSSSASFSATVVIGGSSVSFSPGLVLGALGEYSGRVDLSNLPSVLASEAPDLTKYTAAPLSYKNIMILTNPAKIRGPGTYYFSDTFFAVEDDGVMIIFYSPQIAGVTGGIVLFRSNSGSITFTQYGTETGDTLSGSFDVNISGEKLVDKETGATEIISGVLKGSFDMVISW